MTAIKGNGACQWNVGGWFGSQFGGTLWMIPFGYMAIKSHLAVGIAIIACALIANILGLLLWLNRDKLKPYPAIQSLVIIIGILTTLILCMGYQFELIAIFDYRFADHPASVFWFLLIFPGLLIQFAFVEKRTIKNA